MTKTSCVQWRRGVPRLAMAAKSNNNEIEPAMWVGILTTRLMASMMMISHHLDQPQLAPPCCSNHRTLSQLIRAQADIKKELAKAKEQGLMMTHWTISCSKLHNRSQRSQSRFVCVISAFVRDAIGLVPYPISHRRMYIPFFPSNLDCGAQRVRRR
jgi:hypothetical protein